MRAIKSKGIKIKMFQILSHVASFFSFWDAGSKTYNRHKYGFLSHHIIYTHMQYAAICTSGQSFFYFSFYRPSRPNFLEIEKKEIVFNFIFLFPSDSTGVQLCFFVLSFLLLPG